MTYFGAQYELRQKYWDKGGGGEMCEHIGLDLDGGNMMRRITSDKYMMLMINGASVA